MNKFSAGATASILLVLYTGAVLSGLWLGQAFVAAVAIVVLIWGVFRLVTYRPAHERGAGSLEEIRRSSHMEPVDEAVLACPPEPEKEDGNREERSPLTG